jgi:predicted tellurium resistance membrane protein TerC
MYSVFNKYSNIVMTIIGILLLINVGFIMYKNNFFPFYAKAIYTIVFLFLFIESVLKSRTGKKQEYPRDEEHILNKYLSM